MSTSACFLYARTHSFNILWTKGFQHRFVRHILIKALNDFNVVDVSTVESVLRWFNTVYKWPIATTVCHLWYNMRRPFQMGNNFINFISLHLLSLGEFHFKFVVVYAHTSGLIKLTDLKIIMLINRSKKLHLLFKYLW